MKLTQQNLKKVKWYRQGGAIKLGYISVPWNGCHDMTVNWQPVSLRQLFLMYFRNDFATLFLSRADTERIAQYYLTRENRCPGFIKNLHQQWQKRFIDFRESIIRGELPGRLDSLSDPALLRGWQHAIATYNNLWREAIFHDSFDVMGETLLERVGAKAHRTLSARDLATFTASRELLPMQKERTSLAQLASIAARSPRLRRLVKKGSLMVIRDSFPEFSRSLAAHASTYFWIHNDYAHVDRLTERKFLKAISELLREPHLLHDDRRLLQKALRTGQRQQQLKRHLKLPPRLAGLMDIFSIVGVWRDERKAMNQLGNELMRQFYCEFSRRGQIPLADAEYACWWEMGYVLKPTARFRELLKARRRGVFAYFTGRQNLRTIGGQRGLVLFEFMNSLIARSELRGRTVYPGRVVGTAKLMRGQKDFKRFRRGDILIAPNTRPEYVTIMRLASAIVTEEGGITSHAAIVSRELKIPAVVGVQGILDAVKDGDTVEVDAVHGVVKKV